MPKPVA